MRLGEVKKAMNMKCAMNKLCGGGDTAKNAGRLPSSFDEKIKVVYELFDMFKKIAHSLSYCELDEIRSVR